MDLTRLDAVLEWMRHTRLSEVEIVDGDFRVRMCRETAAAAITATAAPQPAPAPTPPGKTVDAPCFGVVYLSAAAGEPAMVRVGARVEAGEALCLIEAMKTFSKVEAESAGTIAAVLVEDGAEVAAGQPLFRLD
ncbi:acetyl-CoA carboxylase biotin carboxyl carrier protein [Acuticoccus kandeliae]|uniref:acetyl-CoA carboxylase biotin carboxyl carrier protein n=1 Tax=Acuticoccus kandeliae TaxID=2073160 RepID=UPI000D3E4A27|nr:biotin/lipoyl-containing protein [Acuticoccus kandeliae]